PQAAPSWFKNGLWLAQVPANFPSFFAQILMAIPAKPRANNPMVNSINFMAIYLYKGTKYPINGEGSQGIFGPLVADVGHNVFHGRGTVAALWLHGDIAYGLVPIGQGEQFVRIPDIFDHPQVDQFPVDLRPHLEH